MVWMLCLICMSRQLVGGVVVKLHLKESFGEDFETQFIQAAHFCRESACVLFMSVGFAVNYCILKETRAKHCSLPLCDKKKKTGKGVAVLL